MHFRRDDPSGPEIRALRAEHLQSMHAISPPESVRALDLARLRAPDIAFGTVWDADDLLGSGELRQIDVQHGELKSMRRRKAHRGRGVAHTMLMQIIEVAQRRGHNRLSRETGSQVEFAPARRWYGRFGFADTAPFDHDKPDPCSAFMCSALVAVVPAKPRKQEGAEE